MKDKQDWFIHFWSEKYAMCRLSVGSISQYIYVLNKVSFVGKNHTLLFIRVFFYSSVFVIGVNATADITH